MKAFGSPDEVGLSPLPLLARRCRDAKEHAQVLVAVLAKPLRRTRQIPAKTISARPHLRSMDASFAMSTAIVPVPSVALRSIQPSSNRFDNRFRRAQFCEAFWNAFKLQAWPKCSVWRMKAAGGNLR
jgi:hypothetical protein